MALDNHSLSRPHTDALAGFHIHYLKRAQPSHLHLLAPLQLLYDDSKHQIGKVIGIMLRQPVFLDEHSSYLLYGQLSHCLSSLL